MKIAFVCLLAVAAASCSQPNSTAVSKAPAASVAQTPSSRPSQPASVTAAAETNAQTPKRRITPSSAPNAAESWQLRHGSSPMDGEVTQATRVYTLKSEDGINNEIQALFQCSASSHDLMLKFTSTVGDQGNLSKRSAFVFTTTPLIAHSRQVQYGSTIPTMVDGDDTSRPLYQTVNSTTGGHEHLVGRIRFSGGPPRDIYAIGGTAYVQMGSFANVALASLPQWAVIGFQDWAKKEKTVTLSENQLLVIQWSDKFNKIAALKYAFPVVMEVSNGAGTYYLVIDNSRAVSEVLDACGGDGPVIDTAVLTQQKSSSAGSTNSAVPAEAASAQ